MTAAPIPGGFILLSRRVLESEIMKKPPLYFKVWAWLLLNAQYSDNGGLKRGQVLTSIPEIRDAMAWMVGYRTERPSTKQIRGILDWLRNPSGGQANDTANDAMIVTTKVTQKIIVTIVNYDMYQTSRNYEGRNEGRSGGRAADVRRTSEGPNNNKKDKEERKKEDISSSQRAPMFAESSHEFQLAIRLRERILGNLPNARVPKPTPEGMASWCKQIDYILRLDNREPEDVALVIDWCQKDEFWRANIMSPKKLREKWDTLVLQMERGRIYLASKKRREAESDPYAAYDRF